MRRDGVCRYMLHCLIYIHGRLRSPRVRTAQTNKEPSASFYAMTANRPGFNCAQPTTPVLGLLYLTPLVSVSTASAIGNKTRNAPISFPAYHSRLASARQIPRNTVPRYLHRNESLWCITDTTTRGEKKNKAGAHACDSRRAR